VQNVLGISPARSIDETGVNQSSRKSTGEGGCEWRGQRRAGEMVEDLRIRNVSAMGFVFASMGVVVTPTSLSDVAVGRAGAANSAVTVHVPAGVQRLGRRLAAPAD
jgi:hypothetical protein